MPAGNSKEQLPPKQPRTKRSDAHSLRPQASHNSKLPRAHKSTLPDARLPSPAPKDADKPAEQLFQDIGLEISTGSKAAPPNAKTTEQIIQALGLELSTFQKGETLGQWTIERKIGEGGFGAVYLVKNNKGEQFALKTERATETIKVLKMEVFVLSELKRTHGRHFCEIIDSGNINGYNYLVMTLVGPSFQDLRKSHTDPIKQKFSLGCALSVGTQCVEAIKELHAVGYLHRDIKPGNFAIGQNEPRKIYMLDFGMARRFLDRDGQIRRPRWAAGFRGTVRYAPISCHISREQARKDDLETWLYMQIELTSGHLPWKHLEDRDEVGRFKERCREDGLRELFGGCPREYIEIMTYVDELRYYDPPNYQKIHDLLNTAVQVNTLQEFPYDWEDNKP